MVVVGGFDEGTTTIPLEWQRIQMSEIQLIPSASFAYHGIGPEQGEALELLARGKLDARRLISRTFQLGSINEAFEYAANKESTGAIFVGLTI